MVKRCRGVWRTDTQTRYQTHGLPRCARSDNTGVVACHCKSSFTSSLRVFFHLVTARSAATRQSMLEYATLMAPVALWRSIQLLQSKIGRGDPR